MIVEIVAEAAQFLFWEYLFQNFRYCVFAVHTVLIHLVCVLKVKAI
jgi:hypothetical protein